MISELAFSIARTILGLIGLHSTPAPPPRQRILAAHRGGMGESPENTIKAFAYAKSCGMHMVELDVYLTKDHQIVVLHDDNHISQTNYAELPSSVPTLEQVFDQFPDMLINIDLKPTDPKIIKVLVHRVGALVSQYDRADLTVWGSMRDDTCELLYKINQNVPLIFSVYKSFLVVISYHLGLLPFVKFKQKFYEPPLFPFTVIGRLLQYIVCNRGMVQQLQRRGVKVIPWTANSEESFAFAFCDLGTDGVMTDFPSKLQQFAFTLF